MTNGERAHPTPSVPAGDEDAPTVVTERGDATDVSGDAAPADPASPGSGPTETVRLGEVRFTLLGTAHVSRASAEEVRDRIASGRYDAVAVELDASRHAALTDPDRMLKTDLFTVIRSGRAGTMAANLALGAFQQRLADQYGIEPGQEMRDAIQASEAAGVPLWLVDRDLGITLRRVYANVPWWRRLTLMAGLLAGLLSSDEIDEDEIERLKDGDVLESTFAEFAERSQRLYVPLIEERDHYMAARLRQEAVRAGRSSTDGPREVLVVIGAGHLKGLAALLRRASAASEPATEAGVAAPEGNPAGTAAAGPTAATGAPPAGVASADDPDARIRELTHVPPPSAWRRAFPWILVGLILAGFVTGFVRDPDLGRQLVGDWFLINAATTALGTILASAHPLTVVGTVLAAPFTSLNPTIGAGFVAAGLELWRRKPSMGDFATLRRDTTTLRGWYRNRVARTLLVFFGATLGSAVGTYLAGARILTRLF